MKPAVLALVAVAIGLAAARAAAQVPAITVPSQRVEMKFVVPAYIAAVNVKPGDPVKAGQVLVAEDVREEELERQILKLEAESDVAVEYQKVKLKSRKVELARVQEMHEKKVATDKELEEAKLGVEQADLELKKAQEDKLAAELKFRRAEVRIEKMKLLSPVAGVVEKVEVDVGEVADPQKVAVSIVCNDPLWVEMHLPVADAQRLRAGQELPVRYPGESTPQVARVIYFAPEADAGSGTQLVRLAMDNPSRRSSGLQVTVELPQRAAEASGR